MRAGILLYTSFRLLERSCIGNKKKPFTRSFVYLCRYSVSQKPPQHFVRHYNNSFRNLYRMNAGILHQFDYMVISAYSQRKDYFIIVFS